MKKRKPENVSNIINQLVENIEKEHRISEEKMSEAWLKAVGSNAAGATKPIALQNGKLKVLANNTGWIQELTLGKRQILKKLQSILGKELIQDIRYITR